MASQGNDTLLNTGTLPTDAFIVIVKTEWNAHITNELEAGCIKVLASYKIQVETITVPGAVEIPFAIKRHWHRSNQSLNIPSAYIALGCVIQGDTPHFDYVCRTITDGILQLNLTLPVPVIFGVLTVNNEQQALDRIGGNHGHKGEEAAITALKMIG
ncbi:MAG: 6,7-dimethyl-8-ribityllumazine synthase [Niabella sp.]